MEKGGIDKRQRWRIGRDMDMVRVREVTKLMFKDQRVFAFLKGW